jgi:hypothetical protein
MTNEKVKSREMETRLMTISLMPAFIALTVASFYLMYLKASGAELSDSFFLEVIFSVIAVGSLLGLALNELLVWKTEGIFKIKRLVFRWALVGLYFLLFVGLNVIFLTLLPWVSTGSVLALSGAAAAWIFIIIALKKKRLFSRLDKAE